MIRRPALLLAAAMPGALAAQVPQALPLAAAPWPAHVARDRAAWSAALDLRTLPADTRPARLDADIDLTATPPGAAIVLAASVNGRVFAHRRLEGGGQAAVSLPVEQKLFSVVNRIDLGLAFAQCGDGCGAAGARVTALSVAQAPVVAPVTDFARATVRLRRGVAIEVQAGADPALAPRVVAALAPAAPVVAGATARIVVGPRPPAGFAPPLAPDGRTRIETKAGRLLYSADALHRFTVVQLLRDGDRIAIWVRPGPAGAPAALRLDHGDVALFDAAGRAIAWSSQSDDVIRAVSDAPAGGLSVEELRMIGAALFWLAGTAGVLWIARRLPAPRRPAEA